MGGDKHTSKRKEYVNIARLPKNSDPVLIEAARLVPRQSRGYIEAKFGSTREFYVRRDLLLNVFGERQVSVGDLFTGQSRWNKKALKHFEHLAVGAFGKHAYVCRYRPRRTFRSSWPMRRTRSSSSRSSFRPPT